MAFDLNTLQQRFTQYHRLTHCVFKHLSPFNQLRIKRDEVTDYCFGEIIEGGDTIIIYRDFFHTYEDLFHDKEGNFITKSVKWIASERTIEIVRKDGVISITGFNDPKRRDKSVSLKKYNSQDGYSIYGWLYDEQLVDWELSKEDNGVTYHVLDLLRINNVKELREEFAFIGNSVDVNEFQNRSLTLFYGFCKDKVYFGLWDLVTNEPLMPLN